MSTRQNIFGLRWKSTCIVALGLAANCAWAGLVAPLSMGSGFISPLYDGIISPLYVGNVVPALDQNGRPLAGSNRSVDAARRSRVEIRLAADGVINPPTPAGAPHPCNPLVTPTSVGGMGLNAAESDSGLFCMVYPTRLVPGTKIFARAYNAPTVAEASFYVDSRIAVARSNGTSLIVVFGEAQPLDSGDADRDGLNNSWEKALGTSGRLTADFDGDGIRDLDEMCAGTSPTNRDSLLVFQAIQHDESATMAKADGASIQPMRVRFQSVPGKTYQLEFASSLAGAQIFIPVGTAVTAGVDEFEIEMLAEIPADSTAGVFRIKLVK